MKCKAFDNRQKSRALFPLKALQSKPLKEVGQISAKSNMIFMSCLNFSYIKMSPLFSEAKPLVIDKGFLRS